LRNERGATFPLASLVENVTTQGRRVVLGENVTAQGEMILGEKLLHQGEIGVQGDGNHTRREMGLGAKVTQWGKDWTWRRTLLSPVMLAPWGKVATTIDRWSLEGSGSRRSLASLPEI